MTMMYPWISQISGRRRAVPAVNHPRETTLGFARASVGFSRHASLDATMSREIHADREQSHCQPRHYHRSPDADRERRKRRQRKNTSYLRFRGVILCRLSHTQQRRRRQRRRRRAPKNLLGDDIKSVLACLCSLGTGVRELLWLARAEACASYARTPELR